MLRARILASLSEISAEQWSALLPNDHPFVSYAFLEGLERHGCIREQLGWQPHHVTLWRGDELVAAAPCYLKFNSHGEFVFDYAWAEAYQRLGLDYYPKLLAAIPYSPIGGPRLLVREGEPAETRSALARALIEQARQQGLSSVHANFLDADDDAVLEAEGWIGRGDWQFHWDNDGWQDFDQFLGALTSKRRKAIRQERQHLQRGGWTFEVRDGRALDAQDLDFVFLCYARTFSEKGNYPALTREFFAHLARTIPDQVVVAFAQRDGERAAMAYFLRSRDTLYGRYWGSESYVPGLHFECCYYQGIEYCLRHGIPRFEPGAQGEHKVARGFLPALTRSRHWIAHPELRAAIARSLEREREWLQRYRLTLMAHSPYKDVTA